MKINIWLEGQRMKHDLPGFSAGVVHDQELIWSKGYGYADITHRIPATDQTLYRVASITKTFTATAVMQLVEQGRLSLEDAVQKHLVEFQLDATGRAISFTEHSGAYRSHRVEGTENHRGPQRGRWGSP